LFFYKRTKKMYSSINFYLLLPVEIPDVKGRYNYHFWRPSKGSRDTMEKRRRPPSKNRWEDHYSKKARKENFPARSVYKLQEIQSRHRVIRKNDRILDLGCAPGSWLVYAAGQTGDKGAVVGVDLKKVSIPLPANAAVFAGDILDMESDLMKALGADFNLVMSDMAPATSGNKHVDSARSFNLCEAALDTAINLLVPGGRFICKIFQGEDFKAFTDQVDSHFTQHKIFKPKSSRKASKEIFIIGFGKKTGG
jgi:23S rRNA (uridine2552-2'-O)-methyltransferase